MSLFSFIISLSDHRISIIQIYHRIVKQQFFVPTICGDCLCDHIHCLTPEYVMLQAS